MLKQSSVSTTVPPQLYRAAGGIVTVKRCGWRHRAADSARCANCQFVVMWPSPNTEINFPRLSFQK